MKFNLIQKNDNKYSFKKTCLFIFITIIIFLFIIMEIQNIYKLSVIKNEAENIKNYKYLAKNYKEKYIETKEKIYSEDIKFNFTGTIICIVNSLSNEIYLTEISYNSQKYNKKKTIKISGKAKNNNKLFLFVDDLKNKDNFSEIIIKKTNKNDGIIFDLALKMKQEGGA